MGGHKQTSISSLSAAIYPANSDISQVSYSFLESCGLQPEKEIGVS
jgi:hypothetical protein